MISYVVVVNALLTQELWGTGYKLLIRAYWTEQQQTLSSRLHFLQWKSILHTPLIQSYQTEVFEDKYLSFSYQAKEVCMELKCFSEKFELAISFVVILIF